MKTVEDQRLGQPAGHGVDARFGKSMHSDLSSGIQVTSRRRLDLDPNGNVQKTKGRTLRLVSVGWSLVEHREAEGVVEQAGRIGLNRGFNLETEGVFLLIREPSAQGQVSTIACR